LRRFSKMLGEFRPLYKMREVEPVNGCSNLTSVLTHISIGKRNPANASFSFSQTFPVGFFSYPNGSDRTNPCNHHTFFIVVHPCLLSKLFLILIDCLPFVKAKTKERKHLFFCYKYHEEVSVHSKKTGPLRKFPLNFSSAVEHAGEIFNA